MIPSTASMPVRCSSCQRILTERGDPVSEVVTACAEAFGVPVTHVFSRLRTRNVTLARQVAQHILRQRLHYSYPELGRQFGQSDHTSAMAADRKIAAILAKATTSQVAAVVRGVTALLFEERGAA